jgi:hypothetical protein
MLLMCRPIFIIPALAALLLAGCIATAPVSIAWRSNTTLQYATTEGKNDRAADANTVNADRTTETQAALSTSSGTATTAPQDARNKTAQEAAQ